MTEILRTNGGFIQNLALVDQAVWEKMFDIVNGRTPVFGSGELKEKKILERF